MLACVGTPLLLQGEMRSAPLSATLSSYDNGRKCASAIRLDPTVDYAKLKSSVLKQIIKDKGIECKVGRPPLSSVIIFASKSPPSLKLLRQCNLNRNLNQTLYPTLTLEAHTHSVRPACVLSSNDCKRVLNPTTMPCKTMERNAPLFLSFSFV